MLRSLSLAASALALSLLLAASPLACGPSASPVAAARAAAQPSAPRPTPTVSAAPTTSAAPVEPPVPARIEGHRFAVASESATATKAAMDVLERGGHAVDAAITGILTAGVTQPVSSGIGGGGFAIVWDAKKRAVTVLDFRETAPVGIVPGDYAKRPPPDAKRGVMTGVPGEIAGLAELHARFGKLAFADDVRVAAEVAKNGFPVSTHMVRTLGWNERWLRATPRLAFWLAAGKVPGAGATVKNAALAATLERIAAEGRAAFYEGKIADDIVATARAAGSRMTKDDLRGYAVVAREPLRTTWEGREVITMPPPSAGGVMVLETLHMHSKADLDELRVDSGAWVHVLAETFRGAVADRMRMIGDPAFVKMDVAAIVAPERMKARRARIALGTTTVAEKFSAGDSGTSHLVTVDGDGNVVALTSTVNNMFGAKLVTEGGFPLNDELADFVDERLEDRFGIRKGPNFARGGARPVSSMTPTIVLENGAPVLALGGSGGMRIATGVTQVLLRCLAHGASPTSAVPAPRFETPPSGGLLLDPGHAKLAEDLGRRGEVVDSTTGNFSAVQAVSIVVRDGRRHMEAAGDPRKGGAGAVK